jgi:glycosyltransferase involved in cell wall biosynthesis
MKILQINASYKPAYIYGGPTVSVAKLCEELIRSKEQRAKGKNLEVEGFDSPDLLGLATHPDISVEVYTTVANGDRELPYSSGTIKIVDSVPVHYFKRLTKDHSHFSPALLIHLWKTIKKFDLVHIHAWWNLVSVFSAFICVIKGKKYILSPRGTLSSYSFGNSKSLMKRVFHQLLGKPLLKRAIFQVSSEKEKRDIERLIGRNNVITVIPNFVELNRAWDSPGLLRKNRHAELLFFSRIEQKKGLEFLLHACAMLAVPYTLSIAGTGNPVYIRELKMLCEQLGISNQIKWLGLVIPEDKFKVLAAYDLLVLPSYDENFANVVIESLAVGTPVLLSLNVGLADYVLEKNLGWICDQDSKKLAEAITDIFETRKTDEISQIAPAIIRQDYDEQFLTEQYRQFYQQINQHEF